jgi:hypothetical protein
MKETWTSLQRRLNVGIPFTLISFPGNHKYLNIPRKIIKRQSNGIQFAGGSWLQFPPAKEIRVDSEIEFSVYLGRDDLWMTYRFE